MIIGTKRAKAALAAVTVAGATAAAIVIPASPAVAFSSGGLILSVAIQSPALLIAKGAAIGLPVDYVCVNAADAEITVNVTEAVANGALASASGAQQSLVCDGELQTATIDMPATGMAFIKGPGFAEAEIFGCFQICGNDQNSRTVAIQK